MALAGYLLRGPATVVIDRRKPDTRTDFTRYEAERLPSDMVSWNRIYAGEEGQQEWVSLFLWICTRGFWRRLMRA